LFLVSDAIACRATPSGGPICRDVRERAHKAARRRLRATHRTPCVDRRVTDANQIRMRQPQQRRCAVGVLEAGQRHAACELQVLRPALVGLHPDGRWRRDHGAADGDVFAWQVQPCTIDSRGTRCGIAALTKRPRWWVECGEGASADWQQLGRGQSLQLHAHQQVHDHEQATVHVLERRVPRHPWSRTVRPSLLQRRLPGTRYSCVYQFVAASQQQRRRHRQETFGASWASHCRTMSSRVARA